MSGKLRFGVAGLIHETNTFATEFTGETPLSAFEQYSGADIPHAFEGSNHQVGGFIAGAATHNVDLVWTFLGQATPSGKIADAAYRHMKRTILNGLKKALPLDGVLLALHGAGVAASIDDIEGDLLAGIRSLVGPHVPIAAAYDLHGNMTLQMQSACDITLPCRLYPHTDFTERAAQCVELLVRTINGDIRPVTSVRQLPMLQYIVPTTPGFLPSELNEMCEELTAREGVIDCSWFHGFPLSDIAAPCPAVICITDANIALADQCATQAASWLWSRREQFVPDLPSPKEGVALGMTSTSTPFVIGEYSDNPGGGAPGDGTHLLQALIDVKPDPGLCCFAVINDPAVVKQAEAAGVGARISVSLGAKFGAPQGKPVEAVAYVKSITDGRFKNRAGSMFEGVKFDIGPMCRLEIENIDVLVSSRAEQIYDSELFLLHGIDPSQYRIVALKGANHFRAGFRDNVIITVDGGGLSSALLETFKRTNTRSAIWPLQVNASWCDSSAPYPIGDR